jgi:hypothetical protein
MALHLRGIRYGKVVRYLPTFCTVVPRVWHRSVVVIVVFTRLVIRYGTGSVGTGTYLLVVWYLPIGNRAI